MPWWIADNAESLHGLLFGDRDATADEPEQHSFLWNLAEILEKDEATIRSRMEEAAENLLDESGEEDSDV